MDHIGDMRISASSDLRGRYQFQILIKNEVFKEIIRNELEINIGMKKMKPELQLATSPSPEIDLINSNSASENEIKELELQTPPEQATAALHQKMLQKKIL